MSITDYFSDLLVGFGLQEAHAESPPSAENDQETDASEDNANSKTEVRDEEQESGGDDEEEAAEGDDDEEEEQDDEPVDLKPKLEEGNFKPIL